MIWDDFQDQARLNASNEEDQFIDANNTLVEPVVEVRHVEDPRVRFNLSNDY